MKCLAAPIMFTSFEIRVVLLVGAAVESAAVFMFTIAKQRWIFISKTYRVFQQVLFQSSSEARTKNLKSNEKFASLKYSSITFHTFDTKMQFWFLVKSFVFFQIISDCFYIMNWHSLKEIEIIEKDSERNKVTFSRITSKTCWHTLYSVELFIPRCFGFSTFIFVAFSAFCLLPLWKSENRRLDKVASVFAAAIKV